MVLENVVAARLTAARIKAGYTTAEAAERCGISLASINAYERGERIPRDSVKIAFSDLYHISVAGLFFMVKEGNT